MSTKVSSSATAAREKCSRNKRKFRQDPPFPSQGSGDENHCGGNNAGAAVLIEGESWMSEPRSIDAATAKIGCVDSCGKEVDVGTNSASSKTEMSRSYHQEQLKLMRFRTGQARVVQAVAAGMEAKREELGERHIKAADISEEEEEFYELEEVDWDDCTEGELEDLLVKSLGALYVEAINKIVASGRTAEEALRAVLKQGRCYGGKDAVSNIVDNSLAYLNGNRSHATEGRDHSFSDLRELQKYSLAEMVGLLREVRPLLSKGDAMWCLLMCDMNVPLACVMDDLPLPPLSKEPFPGPPINHAGQVKGGSSSSPHLPPPSDSVAPTSSTPNVSNARSMLPPAAASLTPPAPTTPRSVPTPISPSPSTLSDAKSPSPLPTESIPDVSLLSLWDSMPDSGSDETASNFEELASDEGSPKLTNTASGDVCTVTEEGEEEGGVKYSTAMPPMASLKLDERIDPEQESSTESDKNGKTHSSIICEPYRVTAEPAQASVAVADTRKVAELDNSETKQLTSEALQVSGEGNTCELLSGTDVRGSSTHSLDPVKSIHSVCPPVDTGMKSHDDSNCVQPENFGSVTDLREAMTSPVQFGTVDEPAMTVVSDRDSSTIPPSDAVSSSPVDGPVITRETLQAFIQAAQKTDPECFSKESTLSGVPECFSKETSVSGKGEVADQKDEIIMKLIHRSRELETQLQERTEWAKQKVMQAARRLSNDLQELKALRHEREEAQRLKKDKQALEDSTMKKLTDLENALRKASGQVDRANASVRKLEAENAEVRAEMEAAKLSAAEAQSSCQEMAKREKKSTKRALAWERQKAKLQEDLSEEKRKITAHQQQLVLAKERQQQAEVRWRQEEKAKEDATLRADHERRVKEQAETAAKKREESLRRKAESNYQRHREDIQRLEGEIAQFRISAEAAQLATSRWGPGVAVTPPMMELSSLQALKESNNRLSREIAELQDMARRDVHRERECVMCMCEEMSVVFLPCAHQVVCLKCNDLHEKQGMRDCPSCRTPIKQRIRVYGVST